MEWAGPLRPCPLRICAYFFVACGGRWENRGQRFRFFYLAAPAGRVVVVRPRRECGAAVACSAGCRGRSSIFDISLENSPDRLRTKCLQRRDDGRSPALSTGCARRKHCPCGSGRLRNKLLASAAQLFPPVCMRSACGKSPGREWKSRDHSRFRGAERARRKRAPDGKQRGMSRHTRIFIFAAAHDRRQALKQ